LLIAKSNKKMVLIEVLTTQKNLFLSIKNTDLDRRMTDMVNGSFRVYILIAQFEILR